MEFKIGDRVKIINSKYRSDNVNNIYAGKTGVIKNITVPVGIAICYTIVFDEPFYESGYLVEYDYYYNYENALVLI